MSEAEQTDKELWESWGDLRQSAIGTRSWEGSDYERAALLYGYRSGVLAGRAGAAQALEEAANEYASGKLTGVFYGRDDYTKAWLRARAESKAKEIGND